MVKDNVSMLNAYLRHKADLFATHYKPHSHPYSTIHSPHGQADNLEIHTQRQSNSMIL